MLVPLLFVLFVGMPILEIYVIIRVGEAIGVLPTIALLIVDSIVGAWLMRSQGRAVWRRFTAALEQGRPPAREVLDGALVMVGGAMGLAPGFVTDAFALALIAPPSRAVIRRAIVARLARRGALRVGVWAAGRGRRSGPGRPGERDPYARGAFDVEGTAHEQPPDPRRLP